MELNNFKTGRVIMPLHIVYINSLHREKLSHPMQMKTLSWLRQGFDDNNRNNYGLPITLGTVLSI